MENNGTGEIVIYQPDEITKLEVRLNNETVWLTQAQIAHLFGVGQPAISKHLKNIFASGELEQKSVYSILEYTASDGKVYKTGFYNLDAILSIGYRVNSKNATIFRQWANKVLKEYLIRGYSVIKTHAQILAEHDEILTEHEKTIDFFVRTSLPPVEGVFYEGQIFDAYAFVTNLIRSAKKQIILLDNYVDESVLVMLSKRSKGVTAEIYTERISQQLKLDIQKYNCQYPPISLAPVKNIHDRFLIVDEDTYHIGASLKDLGKKLFAFSKMHIESKLLMDGIRGL